MDLEKNLEQRQLFFGYTPLMAAAHSWYGLAENYKKRIENLQECLGNNKILTTQRVRTQFYILIASNTDVADSVVQ